MLTHKNITLLIGGLLVGVFIFDIFFPTPLWVYFLGISVWFLLTLFGSFIISWNYHVAAFCGNETLSEKKIAITFDDGPNPEYTPQVLQLLAKYDAKATFFCIGKNIKQHPELVENILKEGHAIGNHSYNHSPLFGFFGKKKVVNELKHTNKVIASFTGIPNTLFRPPFGVTNPSIAKSVKQLKLQTVGWNIRSFDTVIKNPDRIIQRIRRRVSPGAVILMHDTHDRVELVLEHLLLFLKDNGYQTVLIKDLIQLEKDA